MKQVWVLLDSDDDSTWVSGVYSNKADAEAFLSHAQSNGGYRDARVVEIEKDGGVQSLKKGLLPFYLHCDIDGNISVDPSSPPGRYDELFGVNLRKKFMSVASYLDGFLWAVNQEEAKDAALIVWKRYIDSGEWKPPPPIPSPGLSPIPEGTHTLKNRVLCLSCGETLESKHRHDFVECTCENHTFTDGGTDYIRCGGVDMSLVRVLND